ncbi:hypothetical protein DB41_EC00050 [Neochlamydia sp. TUME1]|nr:hypothetical protein DB41_EC00050 [Neochlamydia sp. TUME1]
MGELIKKIGVDFAFQKPAYRQLRVCNEHEETSSFHFAGRDVFCFAQKAIFKIFSKNALKNRRSLRWL